MQPWTNGGKNVPKEKTEWAKKIESTTHVDDVLEVAWEMEEEIARLHDILGTKATDEDIKTSLLAFGTAYIYKGRLLDPVDLVIRRVAKDGEEIVWERMTKRTDDPKLAWLERQLDKAGIAHRRNGESFHAPIMEVDTSKYDEAWKILDPVDDIPDHDPMWKED